MENKIQDILESIGLNKNEITIYLDLTKTKKSSALDISKRTGIHRSSVYDALKKLIERGFVNEIIEEKRRLFRVLGPEKIRYYIKRKEEDLRSVIPYLKELSGNFVEESEEEIVISKGMFGVREAIMDLLKRGNIMKVFGSSLEAVGLLGFGFLKDFHKERIKNKIVMKHIFSKEAYDRAKELSKMEYTKSACFPKKYFSIVSTTVCGDCILFIIFSKTVSSIKIVNKNVADSYSNYFELLWEQADSC